MENDKNTNKNIHKDAYIKTDNNIVINERSIRWIKKIEECLEVCSKQTGCLIETDTHRICKYKTPDIYNKLNVFFN